MYYLHCKLLNMVIYMGYPYLSRLWLCTFTLSVSIGAALLLPVSIVSNELLLMYQRSYYVKWLNSSLIHGMYIISVWMYSINDIYVQLVLIIFMYSIMFSCNQ